MLSRLRGFLAAKRAAVSALRLARRFSLPSSFAWAIARCAKEALAGDLVASITISSMNRCHSGLEAEKRWSHRIVVDLAGSLAGFWPAITYKDG